MSTLRLGMLQYPITAPPTLEAWAHKLDTHLSEARAAGADLALLPEYAAMETAAALGANGSLAQELARVSHAGPLLLKILIDSAYRHRLWLLAGTLPWPDGDRIRNRAPLITPDRRLAFQDKRVMTRFEREHWGIMPGVSPAVFETPWGPIGISICYDAEFPMLARAQAEAGAKLLLVPSCTDTPHGHHRVRTAARARAMESQIYVAMASTVGEAPLLAALDENHGAAAVFGPIDHGFPPDGILAETVLDTPGWLFADLDLAALDRVRHEGAVRNHADWPRAPPPCAVVKLESAAARLNSA